MADLTPVGVFFAGLVSLFSPCILPLLPAILAFSAEKNKYKPALVILGLVLSFMIMGIITSVFGSLFIKYIPYLQLIAAVLIIFFGVVILIDLKLFYNLAYYTNNIHVEKQGLFGFFLLGLSLGIIWIPCIGPILGSVLMLVASKGNLLYGTLLLTIYSIGFAIPMFLIAYSTNIYLRLNSLLQYNDKLKKVTGIILIITGLWMAHISQINLIL